MKMIVVLTFDGASYTTTIVAAFDDVVHLFFKGTKIKASYAGAVGKGPTVYLDTCRNGEKDGKETDEDCGGLCGGCESEQACKTDSDCQPGLPCSDNVCGIPGKNPASAAESCKALLKVKGGTASGLFWINPDGKGDPFEVYCDQENDGGGWIVLQHLEDARPRNPCGMNSASETPFLPRICSTTLMSRWSSLLPSASADVALFR